MMKSKSYGSGGLCRAARGKRRDRTLNPQKPLILKALILLGVMFCSLDFSHAQPSQGSGSQKMGGNDGPSSFKNASGMAGPLKSDALSNQRVEEQAALNQVLLAAEIGADYAGTWVEYDENKNAYQVVAAKRPVNIKRSHQEGGKIKLVIVENSLLDLNKIHKILCEYMQSERGEPLVFSSAIDVSKNKILVRIRSNREQELISLMADRELNKAAILIEYQDGPSQLF